MQYFVSWQGELEERVLFLHAEYTLSFFFFFVFAFLHYTQGDWKKKGKVSTNTVHYDKSGNGHVFCSFIFTLYNPPLRFGCWVVYKSKNRPLHSTGNIGQFFSDTWCSMKALCPFKNKTKKSAPVNAALLKTDLEYWHMRDARHAWTCRGTEEVIW